jgi:hypothetical protein
MKSAVEPPEALNSLLAGTGDHNIDPVGKRIEHVAADLRVFPASPRRHVNGMIGVLKPLLAKFDGAVGGNDLLQLLTAARGRGLTRPVAKELDRLLAQALRDGATDTSPAPAAPTENQIRTY